MANTFYQGFNPKQLGPSAVYDPDVLTSVFQDRDGATANTPANVGDPVGTLLDISGNGFHATALADAQRPTLRVDNGGRHYLEFSNNHWLNIVDETVIDVATNNSVFSCQTYDITGDPATYSYIWGTDPLDNGLELLTYSTYGTPRYAALTASGTVTIGTSTAAGDRLVNNLPTILGITWDRTTGELKGYVGKTEYGNTSGTAANLDTPTAYVIGGGGGSTARDWTGNWYGTTVLKRIPTTTERDNIVEYYEQKAFNPGLLFHAADAGAWWDPTAPGSLWSSNAGTGSVGPGDGVGRVDDLSGNGDHLYQVDVDSTRPILRRLSDGTQYLEFDGSNDRLRAFANSFMDTNMTFISAYKMRRDEDVAGFVYVKGYSSGEYVWVGQRGAASVVDSQAGSPTYRIDGVTFTAGSSPRDDVWKAVVEQPQVLAIEGFDSSGWIDLSSIGFFGVSDYSGTWFCDMDWYGGVLINRTLTSDERANTEAWYARRIASIWGSGG